MVKIKKYFNFNLQIFICARGPAFWLYKEPRFGVIYPTAAMGNWDIVINQYNKIIEIAPGNTIAMHRLDEHSWWTIRC